MSVAWGRVSPRLAVALLLLLVVAWRGWELALPPRPLPADAPAAQFSATRAMADVRAIGMRPHPLGTADSSRVADYLTRRLQASGLVAEERSYLVDDQTALRITRWSRGILIPNELTNVLGVLPGRDRTKPALLLMAHYDTVWGSPGAADDAAGVAAVLEIVRAIRVRGRPERDLIVLFTDGEETGLSGARAFWAGGGVAARAGLVMNLESRGAGGRALMFETGAGNGALMAAYRDAVARPLANSLATFAYQRMPNNTDFSVPRDRGLPGLNFAFLGRAAYYHSPLATIDRLDPATVQDLGEQALAIAGALAFAPALPARAPDATFFDWGGGRLHLYPAGRGWLLVLAAAALLGFAGWRTRPAPGAVAGGAATLLWFASVAALALAALNALSGAGAGSNYYDRLAALPRLEVQAWAAIGAVAVAAFARAPRGAGRALLPVLALAIAARAAGVAGAGFWWPVLVAAAAALVPPSRDPDAVAAPWLGMAGVLTLAAAVAQAMAAPAAWIVEWPALALALGVAASALLPLLALPAAAVAVFVAAPPLLAMAHLLMLALGAPAPVCLLAVAPTLLALAWPLARMRGGAAATVAVAVLAVAGIAIAVQVRTDPLAETVPAYSLSE